MRIQDYPEQEPTTPQAIDYRDACITKSFGVPFAEFNFGREAHQSIGIYPAKHPSGVCFAFIHGGGWTAGYKETMGFMAPGFAEKGITFVSIGYRLAPTHLFPVGYDDCAAAIAELYKQLPRFGGNCNRISIGGHSAGGHYAALLAVRDDWQQKHRLPHNIIKSCLPISGVFRFGTGSGLSTRPRFLGSENGSTDQAASPILQIKDGWAPPFFIAYGENDFPHLKIQAAEMEIRLRAAGTFVSSIIMPGLTHFTASLAGGDVDGPWLSKAIEFIERTTPVSA